MIRKYKSLVVLILLLTLPLRGLAAIAMWHCGQEMQDVISASAHQHTDHHEQSMETAGEADGHAGHGHGAQQEPSGEKHSSHSASACAAVSGLAFAPQDEGRFAFAPAGASRIPFVGLHFVGVVPAQLDRPPLVRSL